MVTTYLYAPLVWEGHRTVTLPPLRKGDEITLEGFVELGLDVGVYVVAQTLHYLTPKGYHQKVSIRPFKGARQGPLSSAPNGGE